MPPEEAGYTYAVEPTAIDRLLANEEESIYGCSGSANVVMPTCVVYWFMVPVLQCVRPKIRMTV